MTSHTHLCSLALAALLICLVLSASSSRATNELEQDDDNKNGDNAINSSKRENDLRVYQNQRRDIKWPNRQLNVLVDNKSLNQSERLILGQLFDQIEHRTCITIKRLPPELTNPFDPQDKQLLSQLPDGERNFVYIFKSQFGAYNRHPSIGLSSLGCVRQGRQSLVLTDLAFKWPELVLRYHLMRTLGVDNLERPDGQVHKLLNMLPLSQKISSDDLHHYDPNMSNQQQRMQIESGGDPTKWAPSESLVPLQQAFLTFSSPEGAQNKKWLVGKSRIVSQEMGARGEVEYLHEDDVKRIKSLYECPELPNRLSVGPILDESAQIGSLAGGLVSTESSISDASGSLKESQAPATNLYTSTGDNGLQTETASETLVLETTSTTPTTTLTISPEAPKEDEKLKEAEESLKQVIEAAEKSTNHAVDEKLIDEAAKHIVDYLLADDSLRELDQTSAEPSAAPTTTTTIPLETSSLAAGTTVEIQTTSQQPLPGPPQNQERQERSTLGGGGDESSTPMGESPPDKSKEKPMLLRLDDFHAQDPHLQQANEMKLSELNANNLESYRLANGPDQYATWPQQQQQQNFNGQNPSDFNGNFQVNPQTRPGKSEMLISFEQRPDSLGGSSMGSLASSQVLKLCSCTCQTMMPSPPPLMPMPQPPTPLPFPNGNQPPNQSSDLNQQNQNEQQQQQQQQQLVTPPSPQVMPWTSIGPPLGDGQMMLTVTSSPVPQELFTLQPVTWSSRLDSEGQYNGNEQPHHHEERETRTYAPVISTAPPMTTELPPAPTLVTTQPPERESQSEVYSTSEQPASGQFESTAATSEPPPELQTTTKTTTSPMPPPQQPETLAPSEVPTATSTLTPTSSSSEIVTQTTPEVTELPTGDGVISTTTIGGPKSQPMIAQSTNYCDLVEWVAPNKTVYGSPRIVWDVDRANQNYFLCNTMINGELIPGKTHGFSCKISNEGKSYEMHQFNVLTKPEHVNLAWVQKGSSEAFGKTNFPVVGGYAKDSPSDPLVVSRCLVRDERNDVVTLIGYMNNQGVGWFPFDDIQIECAQYDVLACVN